MPTEAFIPTDEVLPTLAILAPAEGEPEAQQAQQQ
jgi:hypothetical protein